jgi:hypothetical protein
VSCIDDLAVDELAVPVPTVGPQAKLPP